jgi:hypothetical protein
MEEIETPDMTPLADLIDSSYSSFQGVIPLFAFLREKSPITIADFEPLERILGRVIPRNFVNALTLSANASTVTPYNRYFSRYQQQLLDLIIDVLAARKSTPDFASLLSLFARALVPTFPRSPHACRMCASIDWRRFGVLRSDGTVDVYDKSSIQAPKDNIPITKIPHPNLDWEKARAEHEMQLPIDSLTVYRIFQAAHGIPTLPSSVYAAIVDQITCPDQRFLSSIFVPALSDIETPLLTIFAHAGCCRRLLKFCIYEEARVPVEPAQIMRMNSLRLRIPLTFMRREIVSYVSAVFNPIKIRLAASPKFDIDSKTDDDMLIIDNLLRLVLSDLLRAAAAMPSSIRFVCKCAFDSVNAAFRDPRMGQRGVFMLFLFRIVFTMLCQPQATDPPGLDFDISKMAKLPKLLTEVFSGEGTSETQHLEKIMIEHRGKVNKIMAILTDCPEDADLVARPTFQEVIDAVEKLREKCVPAARELLAATPQPSEILRLFLLQLVDAKAAE